MAGLDLGTNQLGARLHRLRHASGLTLDELASNSGVSRSMISEIERGRRRPTVLLLDRIATGLGTSIARVLRDEEDLAVTMLPSGEQDVLEDESGWQRRVLSSVLPGIEFEFMRTVLEPGVDAGLFDPHQKGSREYLAVESGSLRLTLDGEQFVLRAGDSIFYPGACHHGFANAGRGKCVYYLVMDLASHAPDGPS